MHEKLQTKNVNKYSIKDCLLTNLHNLSSYRFTSSIFKFM